MAMNHARNGRAGLKPLLDGMSGKPALACFVYGVYTKLCRSFSPAIKEVLNGCYILLWGRVGCPRRDVFEAGKLKKGERGRTKMFWGLCEEGVETFA